MKNTKFNLGFVGLNKLLNIILILILVSTTFAYEDSYVEEILTEGKDYIYSVDNVNYEIPNHDVKDNDNSSAFNILSFYNWIYGHNGITIDLLHVTKDDIILHEYGHYVMDKMYLFDPKNCDSDVEFNVPSECKTEPFKEGWADAFSMAVRDTATQRHLTSSNPPYPSLTFTFEDLNELVDELDSEGGDYVPSPSTASTVAMILWDIVDDKDSSDYTTGEDDDFIYDEAAKFLTVIKDDQPNDILEFYEDWFNEKGYSYTQYYNELYDIYQTHNISKLPNDWGTHCHDQKRTCFTSMKSDLDEFDNTKLAWVLEKEYGDYDNVIINDIKKVIEEGKL